MTRLLLLGAVAAAYAITGKAGLALAYVNESTTAVWPPAGIAVAALLILGRQAWPAIAVGAFLVNVTTSGHIPASLAIAAGNTLEGVAAAWLVERYARGAYVFERTADILRFALLAAGVSCAIAASVGTSALVLSGLAASGDAAMVWLTWWLGDAVGVLTVGPLLVLWVVPGAGRAQPRWPEALALTAVLLGVGMFVFGPSPVGVRHLPLAFLIFPVVLWAAFRFGARASAAAIGLIAVVAIRGTLDDLGPFALGPPGESLMLLQAFVGMTSVVILSVAAEVSARRRVEQDIRAFTLALEDRVRARTEELTRANERFAEAQQVAHIGSWEWDVPSNALWWSDELYRMYGLEPGAPMSYERFIAHVHPEDRPTIEGAVGRALQDAQPFAFEHRILRPDGTERMVYGQGRVLAGTDGRVIRMVGTGYDITERVAAEEQRRALFAAQAAQREAEAASQAKDQFLATLSHELRTPLNVALGWVQVLRTATGAQFEPGRGIETVQRNLQVLTRLVTDIIDVSRIGAGTMGLDRTAVDVGALVRDTATSLQRTAAARSIVIAVTIDDRLPRVRGDADRLQQVVWNLLSNALKFSDERGHVWVTVRCAADGVEIVVEDDGPGIAPAFMPRLFDKFTQADASTSRAHGGLGLGLYIARHLVELHGGSITASNRAGRGAAFLVRLPAEAEPA